MTYLPMLDRPAPMDRLKRMARIMSMVTIIGIGAVAILTILGLVIPDWTRNLLLAKLGLAGAELPIAASARLIIAIIIAVPVGVILYGLFAVRTLFAEFALGHVFTARSARCLQIFCRNRAGAGTTRPAHHAGAHQRADIREPAGPAHGRGRVLAQ